MLALTSICVSNKSGDKTQPWGDPVDDKRTFDKIPLTFTHCDHKVKKSSSQHINWTDTVDGLHPLC